MSQTVITQAFEELKAQEAANGGVLTLDEFVFASVPDLNITDPIDRTEGLPPAAQIVHRQAVSKTGMVNSNAVVYSVVLGADVGDFEFNWVGLLNKASGVVAMIVHAPSQKKIRTQSGQQGNVLTRSFLMEYNGASQQTQIITPADTWQIDFTARLNGVDERIRQENRDTYGAASFLNEGFQVTGAGGSYIVKKGVAYIEGLRAELLFDQTMAVAVRPSKIWVDVCWRGTLTSVWAATTKLTVADNLENYVTGDEQHYVFAIAEIMANGSVIDLRQANALAQLAGLEAEPNTVPYFDENSQLKKAGISDYSRKMLAIPDAEGAVSELGLDDVIFGQDLAKPDAAERIGIPGGRTQADKNAEVISIGAFRPVGMDAYPQFQAALDAAVGKTLHITPGVYILSGGTPIVHSNTRVFIEPGAVIRQPNKGPFGGLATMPGSKKITIDGYGDIIGPWEGGVTPWPNGEQDTARWHAEQAENVGLDIRGRWYQREVLGYNHAQMQALTDVSTDIQILGNLRIEGFGQSAIIADNVTRFTCRRPFLTLCGRDGLRMYGVRRGSIEVDVDTLAPGFDGDYPNFNVYGVTCTRMYGNAAVPDPNMTIGRKSAKCVIRFSTIRNCFTWKGLDTHGGEDIQFVHNDVEGCYICIGVDKGGINDVNGKAIARRILIDSNTFSRGAGLYRRAGVSVFGHNDTDQMAEDVTVTNNIFDNVGGNDIDGALVFSNVKRCKTRGNIFKRPTRTAINMQGRCINFDIGDEIIDTPLRYITAIVINGGSGYTSRPAVHVTGGGGTGLKVHAEISAGKVVALRIDDPGDGYDSAPVLTISGGGGTGATGQAAINTGFGVMVQSGTAKGRIGAIDYTNEDQANVIGVSLPTPVAGYGVAVSGESQFNGVITELSGAINEVGGTYGTMPRATADITIDSNGGVNAISMVNGGSGYTYATVSINGGGGSGAEATATISGGIIRGITITSQGTGYTGEPVISIVGDGSGAAAIAKAVGVILNAERGIKKAIRTGVGVVVVYPLFEDFTAGVSLFPTAWVRSTSVQTATCTGTTITPEAAFTVRTANASNVAVDSRFYCSLAGY